MVILAKDAKGHEEQLNIADGNIWFRAGSTIAVVCGAIPGSTVSGLLYAENLDTKSAYQPILAWTGYGIFNGLGLAVMALMLVACAVFGLFSYTESHMTVQMLSRTLPCDTAATPQCLPIPIPGTDNLTSLYTGPEWAMDLQRQLLTAPFTLALGLGFGFAAIWSGFGTVLARKRYQREHSRRSAFVNQVVNAAKAKGMAFTVSDPMAMQFIRTS